MSQRNSNKIGIDIYAIDHACLRYFRNRYQTPADIVHGLVALQRYCNYRGIKIPEKEQDEYFSDVNFIPYALRKTVKLKKNTGAHTESDDEDVCGMAGLGALFT